MNRTYLLIIFISTLCSSLLFGQNPIGLPDIINYEKTTYGAGTQNWAIQQDRNGILYFANNEGLVTFDGTFWKTYPIANKTIVRSLAIAADHKIYIGAQGDFGYFSPAANGKLLYHSLIDKIPGNNKSFADIWEIVARGNDVFFRSEKRIFKLSNNKITVYNSESGWLFLGVANNTIIAQDKNGLLRYENSRWIKFLKNTIPGDLVATSLAPYISDTLLLATWQNGLYTLSNNTLTRLKGYSNEKYTNEQVSEAFRLNDELLVIATNINGCYIVNQKGSIVYNFSRKHGLQNNSVLSMLKDNHNNIWLGLNNGIDFIANNDAIRHINPAAFDDGVGHSSMLYQGNLYFGLSGAVFKISVKNVNDISLLKDAFRFVPHSEGQAWGMNVVNNRLLLGKHEGAFEVKGDEAINLVGNKGYWNFLSYNVNDEPVVLAGNYNGIDIFSYKMGALVLNGKINGFNESARFTAVDKNNIIWASHPYQGVYKIEVSGRKSPKIRLYNKADNLPSTYNNHVYKIKNNIVVTTEKGIYEYNPTHDKFERSKLFQLFGELYIRYLKEDQQGNVWFVQEKNLGVCDFSGKKPKLIYIPELNGKLVSGFEHVNPIDKNNIIIGAQKGFYHINYEKYLHGLDNPKVRINIVKAIGKTDSLLFAGYYSEVNDIKSQHIIPRVNYSSNSFHFEFIAVLPKNQANVKYSYFLEGFNKDWSEFDKKKEKDYTNVPYGDYIFRVKARNNFGEESALTSYRFVILPPWYQTIFAYLFYVIVGLCLVYLIYKRQQKKFLKQRMEFQKEQELMVYMHQLEIDKSEQEIIKLKNERLITEIETKNTELASTSMHLVQKQELLTKIKHDLSKLNTNIPSDENLYNLKKIIRLLSSEEKTGEGWEQFSIYFDKVHANFLEDLKAVYPNMTSNDLKLAAYLKLGLSTKEIAQLMKISPRGVEISRYRLRKKLQIPAEVTLFNFLSDFKHQER
jgi:ligand-binding sensor domain-containing protein/DNA-binding CsgD family transcriptional regulator